MSDAEDSDRELERTAREYGIPCIAAVDETLLEPALIARIPVEWAREHVVLPVRWEGRVALLTCDPGCLAEQQYLAVLLGEDIHPVLAPRPVVLQSIERCYYHREESPSSFIDEIDAAPAGDSRAGTTTDLLVGAEKAPVSQLVNLILLDAIKHRASDIHFEPQESRLRVRYRIDGVLYERSAPPPHMVEPLVSRLKVMAHMDIAERRLPQDGMTRVSVGERECDIRVSTIPVSDGERVVLRLLDKDSALLSMAELGMDAACFERFTRMISEPTGMTVVCGPTGSGKTTTLYAALGLLDATRRNILTIEDPVEYRLENIGQIQVKPKIGLTFATGLRHILRQDPDVVLVGETRDIETAEIAVRASLTGHLVLTTLHTNDAPSSVVRLIDMGVEPYLLSSCLRGVLAQRLVRRLCAACSRSSVLDAAISERLVGDKSLEGRACREPVGCAACLDGYRGRMGIFELMGVTAAIRDAINGRNSDLGDLRDIAVAAGMVPLVQAGLKFLFDGATSAQEVISTATS